VSTYAVLHPHRRASGATGDRPGHPSGVATRSRSEYSRDRLSSIPFQGCWKSRRTPGSEHGSLAATAHHRAHLGVCAPRVRIEHPRDAKGAFSIAPCTLAPPLFRERGTYIMDDGLEIIPVGNAERGSELLVYSWFTGTASTLERTRDVWSWTAMSWPVRLGHWDMGGWDTLEELQRHRTVVSTRISAV
jgi:hypothetical protein